MQRIVILGAGPAGLGAALQLSRRGIAEVTVIDQNPSVGGLAGSFDVSGVTVDYGSHRLHPACSPRVLRDLQNLLGYDLLSRPRHGRIRLRGHWIGFPLRPLDLVRHLPFGVALGAARDALLRPARLRLAHQSSRSTESFASVMRQGVGPSLYNAFYRPYARKIWGLEPEAISSVQATRRVAARSPLSLLRKATAAMPIIGNRARAAFYYPRGGYGQISQRLAEASEAAGARMMLGSRIEAIDLSSDDHVSLRVTCGDRTVDVECDQVWSTIPIPALVDRLTPTPPESVCQAASALTSRAMVLVYLTLETDQFTGFDTHYFPEQNVPFSRVSEPKHFSGDGPRDRTVLCAEIPTSVDSDLWRMPQADATQRVANALADVGLPISAPISDTLVVRLPNVYPIYPVGFESSFDTADAWLSAQERLVSFGRQGIFAHNNLHHVLDMAYAAVDCLDADARFDRQRWRDFRTEFDHQVVVD